MLDATMRSLALASALAAASASGLHAQQNADTGGVEAPEGGLQGFSQERLDRIATAMEREIEDRTIPGAVTLIARNGEIVHLEAHGHLDADGTEPMTTDALFRAFSMTKPVVSVAAMMLAEQGEISLRDPITDYLPEFADMTVLVESDDAESEGEGEGGEPTYEEVPAENPITVQDLLRHTSGFGYSNNVPKPIEDAYNEADIESRETDFSPDEFVSRLAEIPLVYQPGTRWHYGLSTDVLGVLLERASGQRLDELLEEMIFDPLAMEDTTFQVEGDETARLADAFDDDPQKESQWQWVRVEEDPGERYRLGGAALVTTAEDYFRFAQMVLNGGELDGERLLSPETVEHMLSDHIVGLEGDPLPTTGPGYGFGLGWGVRKQEGVGYSPGSVGDAMWAGAGGTSFTIDPQEDIVAVFMAAAPSTRQHTRFLFKNLVYGALTE